MSHHNTYDAIEVYADGNLIAEPMGFESVPSIRREAADSAELALRARGIDGVWYELDVSTYEVLDSAEE
jgi:hypothetical protein